MRWGRENKVDGREMARSSRLKFWASVASHIPNNLSHLEGYAVGSRRGSEPALSPVACTESALFLPGWMSYLENTGAGSNKLTALAFWACGEFTFSEFTLQKNHNKWKYAGHVLINSWSWNEWAGTDWESQWKSLEEQSIPFCILRMI